MWQSFDALRVHYFTQPLVNYRSSWAHGWPTDLPSLLRSGHIPGDLDPFLSFYSVRGWNSEAKYVSKCLLIASFDQGGSDPALRDLGPLAMPNSGLDRPVNLSKSISVSK